MVTSRSRTTVDSARSDVPVHRSPRSVSRFVAKVAIAAAGVSCFGLLADATVVAESATAVEFSLGSGMDPATGQAAAALDALSAGDTPGYVASLTSLAASIGARVGIDPARMVEVWAVADQQSMTALLSAMSQLGVSYRYASSKPGVAFDCSGLVKWAWAQAGVDLPSNSSSIIKSMTNTSTAELEPGDVLWYPGHVMLALGVDDAYIHAVGRGKPLEVRAMYSKHRTRVRAADPIG